MFSAPECTAAWQLWYSEVPRIQCTTYARSRSASSAASCNNVSTTTEKHGTGEYCMYS